MDDVIKLQKSLNKITDVCAKAAELVASVEAETKVRLKRLPLLQQELNARLEAAQSSAEHRKILALVKDLTESSKKYDERLKELAKLGSEATRLQGEGLSAQKSAFANLLALQPDHQSEKEKHLGAVSSNLSIQCVAKCCEIQMYARLLAVAKAMELYFVTINDFLGNPPLARRVLDACKQLARAIGEQLRDNALPGFSLIKKSLELLDANEKKRKLISISTEEFQRFYFLQDGFSDLEQEIGLTAVALNESTVEMLKARSIIHDALVLLTYTVDIDKISSQAPIDLIKLLHGESPEAIEASPA